MRSKIIDTNVIIRFLVDAPDKIQHKFKGVFSFFEKLERKDISAELPELVLFEAFFVLTGYYKIPREVVAEKLSEIVLFSGIEMPDKILILSCMDVLKKKKVDLVDAYIYALSKKHGNSEIYSFDSDLKKLGLPLSRIG